MRTRPWHRKSFAPTPALAAEVFFLEPAQAKAVRAGRQLEIVREWVRDICASSPDQAVAGIALLASHPALPAWVKEKVPLPQEVCRSAAELEALRAAGFNLKAITPSEVPGGPRIAALMKSASMAVHQVLSDGGVPDLPLSEARHQVPIAVRLFNARALDYLLCLPQMRSLVASSLEEPGSAGGLATVLGKAWATVASEHGFRKKSLRRMLHILLDLDMPLRPAFEVAKAINNRSRDAMALEEQWLEQERVNRAQTYLGAALPKAAEHAPPRPRL